MDSLQILELIGAIIAAFFIIFCWVMYFYEQKNPPKKGKKDKGKPTDLMDWTQM